MLTGILIAAAASTGAAPAPLKTFSDWVVACDNGRACQAVGLQREDDVDGLTLLVRRGAERGAVAEVRVALTSGTPVAVGVDGKRLAVRVSVSDGEAVIDPLDMAAFIAAIRNGRQIDMINASGATFARASLSGASAALLYMDDKQGRVGTITALVKPGGKSAAAVPAPPALPVIVSPPPTRAKPRQISKAQADAELKPLECGPDGPNDFKTEHYRLDARSSLALLPWPCGNGAYNYFSNAVIVEETGRAVRAKFEVDPGMGEENDGTVVNANWDIKTRLLTSFAKGRGVGDCGTINSYAWDGRMFRLVRQETMDECRGSVDYITTWRARVVQR